MAIQTWDSFEGQDSNRIPLMAAFFVVAALAGATHGDLATAGPSLQLTATTLLVT